MSKDPAGSAAFLGLRDIVAHAGVSHMTVSRVIRRPETVAEPTRRRVLAAIEALGYVPNLAARDLVRGWSSFVCMVVSSLQNVFFAATVEGLVRGLDPLGLQVMVGDAGFSAEREARLVRGFVARRPAGVVLTLSTIAAPLEEMGHEAAQLIAGALAGEDIRGRVRDLGLSLIARESTARAG